MSKRVVLFGLSANPPTGLGGHMGIVKYFSGLFDEVWILPVYRHAYLSKRQLEPFDKRMEMISLSLIDCGLNDKNIYNQPYERDCFYSLYPDNASNCRDINFGTIDTITWLKNKFPYYNFSMIVGEDAFIDIKNNKWKESSRLRQSIHFEVLRRKGFENECILSENWFTDHPNVVLLDISSTYPFIQIHNANLNHTMARSTSNIEELKLYVTLSVAEYIKDHHLYSFKLTIYLTNKL